jgi:aminoglycoside phosphotransferase (APT) family kinase protein
MSNADPSAMAGPLAELLRRNGESDVEVSDIAPISGGYSLLTYGFTVTTPVGQRRFVLRMDPPAGASLTHTDRGTEWDLLAGLTAAGAVPMPAARAFDDGGLLGRPGIVLDFVDGPQLGAHAAAADDEERRRLAGQLAETLAAVHGFDWGRLVKPPRVGTTAAPGLAAPPGWDDYVDGLIAAWRAVEANHAERNPFLRYVACWLETHKPPPAPLTLVHGEFQAGNVMIDGKGQMQVIDWEYAHIGDPRIDLGWFQNVAAFSPPDLIGLDPVGFCARYCELTGAAPEVINPLTVGYFSILAGVKAFGALLGGIAAMARGENHLLTSAYLVSAEPFTHRLWMGGTRQLEAAMAALMQAMEEDGR